MGEKLKIRYLYEIEATLKEQKEWIENPITKQLFEMCSDFKKQNLGDMFIGLQGGLRSNGDVDENKCVLHFMLIPS